ncbi:hypothetical protein EVAR_65990_1 [Eumeta japonica]|uniref:Uncharacterized protein n=1 Tax=Eumeta variegata TaxID=151549 RepID=A0A4C1ZNX4_EUMVA|nr:hypothetical protein EVAR_65990_1 [Eumeta japonica]
MPSRPGSPDRTSRDRLLATAILSSYVGCVRPLSLFYLDASANGAEERSLVPRSRSHARFKRNATMSHAFSPENCSTFTSRECSTTQTFRFMRRAKTDIRPGLIKRKSAKATVTEKLPGRFELRTLPLSPHSDAPRPIPPEAPRRLIITPSGYSTTLGSDRGRIKAGPRSK